MVRDSSSARKPAFRFAENLGNDAEREILPSCGSERTRLHRPHSPDGVGCRDAFFIGDKITQNEPRSILPCKAVNENALLFGKTRIDEVRYHRQRFDTSTLRRRARRHVVRQWNAVMLDVSQGESRRIEKAIGGGKYYSNSSSAEVTQIPRVPQWPSSASEASLIDPEDLIHSAISFRTECGDRLGVPQEH